MDFFGIGQAIRCVVQVYFMGARATGRTQSMVESLRDGDRVWFAKSKEANRVKRICKDRNLDVECLVCNPSYLERIFEHGTAKGRVIIDHGFVETMYMQMLEQCADRIRHIEQQTSHADGQGEAHIQTRLKARELQKWQI